MPVFEYPYSQQIIHSNKWVEATQVLMSVLMEKRNVVYT